MKIPTPTKRRIKSTVMLDVAFLPSGVVFIPKPELGVLYVFFTVRSSVAVVLPVLLIISLLMEVLAEDTGTCAALQGGIGVFVSLQMRDFAQTPPFWITVVLKCLHLDNSTLILVW